MKLAVIGLGFMGLTHLRALQAIPNADVVVVASDNPDALTGDLTGVAGNLGVAGERFDFSSVAKYADWTEAVNDARAEAVDLCLPTHLHEPAAVAALEAGKHVLLEKPMALTGAAADRILAAARAAGRTVMIAHVLRFFPDYVPLIELHRSNELGPLRSAVFRRRCAAPNWGDWLPDPAKSGGAVLDLLIHDVDMALHLFGAPRALSATGHEDRARGIDVATAQLHYAEGGTAIVTGGWHHSGGYPFSMEYTVCYDGGTVDYSSAGRPPTLYRANGETVVLERPGTDGYQAEIEYFVECVAGGGRRKGACRRSRPRP